MLNRWLPTKAFSATNPMSCRKKSGQTSRNISRFFCGCSVTFILVCKTNKAAPSLKRNIWRGLLGWCLDKRRLGLTESCGFQKHFALIKPPLFLRRMSHVDTCCRCVWTGEESAEGGDQGAVSRAGLRDHRAPGG